MSNNDQPAAKYQRNSCGHDLVPMQQPFIPSIVSQVVPPQPVLVAQPSTHFDEGFVDTILSDEEPETFSRRIATEAASDQVARQAMRFGSRAGAAKRRFPYAD